MLRGLTYLLCGLLLWTFTAYVFLMNQLAGPSALAMWLMPAYWALVTVLVMISVVLAFLGTKKTLASALLWLALICSVLAGLFLLFVEPDLKAAEQQQAEADLNQHYLDNVVKRLQCPDASTILLTRGPDGMLAVAWLDTDQIRQPAVTLFRHYLSERRDTCRAYRNEYQLGQQRAVLSRCQNAAGDKLADLMHTAEKAECKP